MSEWSSKDTYEIFKDFYGEDRVDYKEGSIEDTILIYFPEETVTTNETGNSIKIYDIYIKIIVSKKGNLKYTFTLNRTTYTKPQYYSRYKHSHASISDINCFSTVCLGSGPINQTIANLNNEKEDYYKDENMWKLFFFELQNWLRTESLGGGPYNRIDNIGLYRYEKIPLLRKLEFSSLYLKRSTLDILSSFTSYFIKHTDLKFSFTGRYKLSYSLYNFTKIISNAFVKWLNENSDSIDIEPLKDIVILGTIDNGVLKYEVHEYNMLSNTNSIEILTFKGEPKYLKIIETGEDLENIQYTTLHPAIVMHIMNTIENSINYLYGREKSMLTESTFLV